MISSKEEIRNSVTRVKSKTHTHDLEIYVTTECEPKVGKTTHLNHC